MKCDLKFALTPAPLPREREDSNCALTSGPLARPPQERGVAGRRGGLCNRAFTLLEIMIVVGIMGIVLGMGVPIVYKAWHKAPMTHAVSDLVEVCSHARALAILQGKEVDVIFHPHEGRFEVGAAGSTSTNQALAAAAPGFGLPSLEAAPPASGLSGHFPDRVSIELMDINKLPHEFRDDDLAKVRFFPNGTCDELTMILVSDQNERREVTLEITTGLVNVESDPRKFR